MSSFSVRPSTSSCDPHGIEIYPYKRKLDLLLDRLFDLLLGRLHPSISKFRPSTTRLTVQRKGRPNPGTKNLSISTTQIIKPLSTSRDLFSCVLLQSMRIDTLSRDAKSKRQSIRKPMSGTFQQNSILLCCTVHQSGQRP